MAVVTLSSVSRATAPQRAVPGAAWFHDPHMAGWFIYTEWIRAATYPPYDQSRCDRFTVDRQWHDSRLWHP